MLSTLYKTFIAGKQKAVAAFLVAALGSFLARHGITINASAAAYMQSIALGLLAHLLVFSARNK